MYVEGSPFIMKVDSIEQGNSNVGNSNKPNATQTTPAMSFNQDSAQTQQPLSSKNPTQKLVQDKLDIERFVYKGNLFNTYLIYEYENEAYLIDQHAAHERLLYDSFKEKLANRKVNRQGMLVPYIFMVNADEKQFMEKNLQTIRDMGFDIEPFGAYSYRVNEVPYDLKDLELEPFFQELLAEVNTLKAIQLSDLLKDKIAMMACKSAVKGGWELTQEEISKLFERMGGNMGLKCPHGRPVCVKLTKTDIEKMFKRIV
jgi:DNA mismatch repair protein MutL